MKKLTFTSLCCFALAFMSCQKKEYTCHCDGGFSGNGDTFIIKKSSKGNAKSECYNYNTSINTNDGFHNCELK
ncbi:MAG: hypothetical protein V4561_11385 [Bacteroidota bacterium]